MCGWTDTRKNELTDDRQMDSWGNGGMQGAGRGRDRPPASEAEQAEPGGDSLRDGGRRASGWACQGGVLFGRAGVPLLDDDPAPCLQGPVGRAWRHGDTLRDSEGRPTPHTQVGAAGAMSLVTRRPGRKRWGEAGRPQLERAVFQPAGRRVSRSRSFSRSVLVWSRWLSLSGWGLTGPKGQRFGPQSQVPRVRASGHEPDAGDTNVLLPSR